MEENNNMENLEGTTPQEVPGAEPTETTPTPDTPKDGVESEIEEGSETVPNTETEPFLPITFNHESVGLDKEEAVRLAQLGMKYEKSGFDIDSAKTILGSLDYLAAQNDISVEELVDGMLSKDEADYRRELEAKFGEEDTETIEDMLEIRRNKQQEKYQNMLETRKNNATKQAEEKEQTLNNRLATEFIELKAEFPEIAEFKDLPNEVKAEAVKGRDLLSAYLRYKHNEDRKIEAAKKTAAENSKATTGSGGSVETAEDGITSALMSGIWK